jgi:hypothetical protein
LGSLFDAVDAVARTEAFLFDSTALETAFIEVGDAFQLEVVSVTPAVGSVGDALEILIRGQYFDPARDTDFVEFCGGARAERQTATVANQAGGTQKITVRVPGSVLDLPPWVQAKRTLTIEASGRRGIGQFEFLARPTVTRMEPSEGFAATPDFTGAPFAGTTVRLQGYGFGPEENFSVGGTEATDKSGIQGDMSLRVPAGAGSGPIRIVRDADTPHVQVGFSPPFTVLRRPALTGLTPTEGPAGTTVRRCCCSMACRWPTCAFRPAKWPPSCHRARAPVRARSSS